MRLLFVVIVSAAYGLAATGIAYLATGGAGAALIPAAFGGLLIGWALTGPRGAPDDLAPYDHER